MKLAIPGATGGTGQELTKQALALGHTVRVLVRSPEKVQTQHERLGVVKADMMNEPADELAEKFGPSEVVISSLGTGTKRRYHPTLLGRYRPDHRGDEQGQP